MTGHAGVKRAPHGSFGVEISTPFLEGRKVKIAITSCIRHWIFGLPEATWLSRSLTSKLAISTSVRSWTRTTRARPASVSGAMMQTLLDALCRTVADKKLRCFVLTPSLKQYAVHQGRPMSAMRKTDNQVATATRSSSSVQEASTGDWNRRRCLEEGYMAGFGISSRQKM